jgi:hypothetical protein
MAKTQIEKKLEKQYYIIVDKNTGEVWQGNQGPWSTKAGPSLQRGNPNKEVITLELKEVARQPLTDFAMDYNASQKQKQEDALAYKAKSYRERIVIGTVIAISSKRYNESKKSILVKEFAGDRIFGIDTLSGQNWDASFKGLARMTDNYFISLYS